MVHFKDVNFSISNLSGNDGCHNKVSTLTEEALLTLDQDSFTSWPLRKTLELRRLTWLSLRCRCCVRVRKE